MASPLSIPSHISVLLFIISYLMCIVANPGPRTTAQSLHHGNRLRNDSDAIQRASNDYGNIVHEIPSDVLSPSSVKDIINLIKSSNNCPTPPWRVVVVVDMTSLSKNGRRIRISGNSSSGFYADVGGEQLWIDVLRATLEHGLAPVSWTDYLYLSVGGTLSNAGVSGQSFLYGPQISNVLELDVITGKGKFITCSKNRNSELFFAVLGGLGQFGIITRARIILEKAPTRVNQEHLISSNAPNYVEGFLITNENTTNEWRSSFSSPSRQSEIVSLLKKQGLLYSIELVKYYDDHSANTIDKEFRKLLKELNFIPGFIFSRDASLVDFLNRVGNLDSEKGPLDSHPWLHLFVPKSRILDFNAGALATIIPRFNETSGVFLFFPLDRKKWDDRMSAVTPDEDIFYMLALLHSSRPDEYQIIDKLNNEIVRFCEKAGIKAKQYLAYYKSKQDWIKNYGSKWGTIQQRKAKFDPKNILSPGQRIFNSDLSILLPLAI
ncbi:hypothetical protein Pfo_000291 [Paulownia fortunei]|nr:hypothetical protein Pfo_000291 [Paulownia fortunei]